MRNFRRKDVYNKYKGHCAYCGKPIEFENMQVDHQYPRSLHLHQGLAFKEHDDFMNLFPACKSCNYYKHNFLLEEFRTELKKLLGRCKKKFIVKLALSYGLLKEQDWDGKFYFETYEELYGKNEEYRTSNTNLEF